MQENRYRTVLHFVKRPTASSEQGGPCTGSLGGGVPCQGVAKWLRLSSAMQMEQSGVRTSCQSRMTLFPDSLER